MSFVKVASAKSLGAGKMMASKAGSADILLANVGGKFYAIGNKCMHMGCKLASGTMIGGNVTCPCHGSTYSLKTGDVIKGPAKSPEPSYKVKLDGDSVMVEV